MTTKISRANQFYEALDRFMTQYFIDTGKLEKWDISLQTQNTRKNIHIYNLILPYNHIAYYLDNAVTRSDGTIEGPGAVYLSQMRPELNVFREVFCDYFKPFEWKEKNQSLSGVHFHKSIETPNGDIMIELMIVYYKNHQPYPIRLTREQCLEIKLQKMHSRAIAAEERYVLAADHCEVMQEELDYLREDYYRSTQRHMEKFNKLERVFRKVAMDAYVAEGKDCPICLEPIPVENLHITLCAHYICNGCNSKCSKCPLCREEY